MLLHALTNMVIKTIFDPLWRGTPTFNDDIDVRKSSKQEGKLLVYRYFVNSSIVWCQDQGRLYYKAWRIR